MAIATKQPRGVPKPAGVNSGSRLTAVPEFAPGSLEAELSALGASVKAREWAKVPADYFTNLDHYRCGAPKKQ